MAPNIYSKFLELFYKSLEIFRIHTKPLNILLI